MSRTYVPTLGKQSTLAILCVLAEVPSVTEIVISFDELNSITFSQTKLVVTSGFEIICCELSARRQCGKFLIECLRKRLPCIGDRYDSRMTSSNSPGSAVFGDEPRCLYAITLSVCLAPPRSLASSSVSFHRRRLSA